MRQVSLATLFCLLSASVIAAITEKTQKKLDSVETAFQQAVAKADNTRFYAVQKATADKVKVLKLALTEATKGGDLDGANEIKARITAAESAAGMSGKPQNVIKIAGHEYAFITDKTAWHVAKRLCEEMGGHLVTIESADENRKLAELCGTEPFWIGATDEETEGMWKWVTGAPLQPGIAPILRDKFENEGGIEHAAVSSGGTWNDVPCGTRFAFVCEWDK